MCVCGIRGVVGRKTWGRWSFARRNLHGSLVFPPYILQLLSTCPHTSDGVTQPFNLSTPSSSCPAAHQLLCIYTVCFQCFTEDISYQHDFFSATSTTTAFTCSNLSVITLLIVMFRQSNHLVRQNMFTLLTFNQNLNLSLP